MSKYREQLRSLWVILQKSAPKTPMSWAQSIEQSGSIDSTSKSLIKNSRMFPKVQPVRKIFESAENARAEMKI